MTTTPKNADIRSKAVVAFLDGRRLKGYIYNFSSQKDRFRLFFEQDTLQREGTDVQIKDLKAIFLAKNFVGTTDAYNPQKIGFFMVPADPRSNNQRVFVVSKNAVKIHWL